MTRRIAATAAFAGLSSLIVTAPASAQHLHGHYDYHPGHYDYHQGHHHYHPGHYDYHGPAYRQPSYAYPQQSYIYPQPTYISPPRTTYLGGSHPHEHASGHTVRRIEFGGLSHIDDLAMELEHHTNDLCLELHYNYQHNHGFPQVYREAYEILTTAKYIHGLEHAGNRDTLRQAVGQLDRLFHHVERHVANWTGHHHRQVGHGGLTSKLEVVEQTLHHLMDDVGVRPVAAAEQAPQSDPVIEAAPRAPAPRGSYVPGSAPPAAYAPGSYPPRRSAPPAISAPEEELGPPPADAPLNLPN